MISLFSSIVTNPAHTESRISTSGMKSSSSFPFTVLHGKGVPELCSSEWAFGVRDPRENLSRKLSIAFILTFNSLHCLFVSLVQSLLSLRQVLQSSFDIPYCWLAHEGIHM